jgi:hypothetical protein
MDLPARSRWFLNDDGLASEEAGFGEGIHDDNDIGSS